MENNEKLVSIVMCTYNGSRFIRPQLDSICSQTYNDLEIIICDDASADETFSILQGYALRDQRIRLFRNKQNLGFTKNFEQACALCNGSYIAFSDQDDIWHTGKIQRMIEGWKPGCPLMYCDSVRFSGDSIPANPVSQRNYRRFEGNKVRRLGVMNTISGHAMIIEKSFLKLITPFPEELMYDWWSGVVAACNGGVGLVNEILVFQRVHGNNISIRNPGDSRKAYHQKIHRMITTHLKKFAQLKEISAGDASFFRKLGSLMENSLQKKFSLPLFLFAFRYRKTIFFSKHKAIVFFSHLKQSKELSTN